MSRQGTTPARHRNRCPDLRCGAHSCHLNRRSRCGPCRGNRRRTPTGRPCGGTRRAAHPVTISGCNPSQRARVAPKPSAATTATSRASEANSTVVPSGDQVAGPEFGRSPPAAAIRRGVSPPERAPPGPTSTTYTPRSPPGSPPTTAILVPSGDHAAWALSMPGASSFDGRCRAVGWDDEQVISKVAFRTDPEDETRPVRGPRQVAPRAVGRVRGVGGQDLAAPAARIDDDDLLLPVQPLSIGDVSTVGRERGNGPDTGAACQLACVRAVRADGEDVAASLSARGTRDRGECQHGRAALGDRDRGLAAVVRPRPPRWPPGPARGVR